jgi:hypothetical protein
VKYAFITQHKNAYPISLQCQVLGVSRNGYYQYTKSQEGKPEDPVHQEMIEWVQDIAKSSDDTYGSRRMKKALNVLGYPVSREKARKLMREANVQVRHRKKYKVTTNSNHKQPVFENLVEREFDIDRPDQVYAADITYVWTQEGWLYLAVVIDLCTRKVVGWSMSSRMKTQLVCDALQMAIWRRQPKAGLIHHSDRGSQYASKAFRRLLKAHGIEGSMSRKGDCWDNGVPRAPGRRCSGRDESMASRTLVAGPGFKPRRAAEVKSLGGERRRKRRRERRQVCDRKTNASEPLMTRRKAIQLTSKPGSVVGPGQVRTRPAYGPSGVRRGGGVILSQALSGNVGTCRLDAKGDVRGSSPSEDKSTDARHRGGAARSSVDVSERILSKGAASFCRVCVPTCLGRSA